MHTAGFFYKIIFRKKNYFGGQFNMEQNKEHSYGLASRMMYGMAEFYGGGAFVIITRVQKLNRL